MKYTDDDRIVMTLDAGGTNFVFTAIQSKEKIVDEITLPSYGNNLEKCLNNIVQGFNEVKAKLPHEPVAISFAFPGPADYPNGIIGDLTNLPAFRGGVALGPFLENKFDIPVFINNDGDLYSYGEAIFGFLPELNQKLMDNLTEQDKFQRAHTFLQAFFPEEAETYKEYGRIQEAKKNASDELAPHIEKLQKSREILDKLNAWKGEFKRTEGKDFEDVLNSWLEIRALSDLAGKNYQLAKSFVN